MYSDVQRRVLEKLWPSFYQYCSRSLSITWYSIVFVQLSTDPFGIFALVLTPTRELAFQIGDQFNALGKQLSLKCSVIVGGRHQMAQAQDLVRRPHIVIATPGFISN